MPELYLRNLAWALNGLLQAVLLFYIARQRAYRLYPAFSAYVLLTAVQNVVGVWSAWHWGIGTIQYFNVFWGTQAAVVCLRWLAVLEIARHVLASYSGIWKMASSVLFFMGAASIVYALMLSRFRWDLVVLNADRAVELCIAVFVVGMLLFARYYRLGMTNTARQLVIGFALFSCAWVVANSVVLYWPHLGALWDVLQMIAFAASLTLWIRAVRSPAEATQPLRASALPVDIYGQFSQQLDARLRILNEKLDHLLRSEDSRP